MQGINCNNTFYQVFNDNMEAMGLPAPKNLFGNLVTATASIRTLLALLDKFGPAATMGELAGATTLLEGLDVILAVSAAYYIGGCIGSLAVATANGLDRAIICRNIAITHKSHDLIRFAWKNNLYRPWLNRVLLENPKLLGAA